jgi:signal transduction histidine kinase
MILSPPNPNPPALTPEEPSGKLPTPRELLRHFLMVSAFNLAVALFITLVIDHKYRLFHHLVFAFAIGTLGWIFLDVGRYMIWGRRKPPASKFFLMLLLVAPLAYYGGGVIGLFVLSMPLSELIPKSAISMVPEFAFLLFTFSIAGWMFLSRAEMAELRAEAAARAVHSAAVEKQAMQAQLQLLQTQVEPHMLFNTLANLQGLIAIDPTRAQNMLDHLILYLRATLASSRASATTLSQEFALLEAYLGLMAVRMGPRLSYELHLPDELRKQRIPPMLLQPLIENAIKHGLEPKVDGGRVDIKAERKDAKLLLTVADTGLGMDENGVSLHSQPGTQVGMANVRERLHVLYGDAATFTLSPNTPTGVIAQLTIPTES